jgi:hypothetical protein
MSAETEALHAAWAAGRKAGIKEATQLDAQLARELGQLTALLERLDRLVRLYAEREVEDGSVYWSSEP